MEVKDGSETFTFDLKLLDVLPFRLESMKFYPYKSREGDIPMNLLKVKELEFIIKQSELIREQ